MRLPRKFNKALPQLEVISPQEAAADAYAPGATLTKGLGVVSDAIEDMKTRDEQSYVAESRADVRERLLEWQVSASNRDLSPDEYASELDAFQGELETEIMGNAPTRSAQLQMKPLLDEDLLTAKRIAAASLMRENKRKAIETQYAALNKSFDLKNYDAVLAGVSESTVMTESQKEAWRTDVASQKLFDQYERADDKGGYLTAVANMDLRPEVESRFTAMVKGDLDLRRTERSRAETAAQVDRALIIADFKQAITPYTTDDDIENFSRNAQITDHGTITGFYSERQKEIEAAEVFKQDFIDPTDPRTRKLIDRRVAALTDDPQGRIDAYISVAADSGVTGEGLERHFEGSARSEQAFQKGAENFLKFKQQAPKAYLPLSADAQALYAEYSLLTMGGMESTAAANAAWATVKTSAPQVIKARAASYPAEEVSQYIIHDLNDIPGMHKDNPWYQSDDVAPVPPEMLADINRIGLSAFTLTGSKDSAIEAVRQNLPNGWAYTDVNEGVGVGDDQELKAQYMQSAPKRDTKFVRKTLAQDFSDGRLYFYGNDYQELDTTRVELYQPPTPEKNEYGQNVWFLRVDGVLVLDESYQAVRWTYEKPPEPEPAVKRTIPKRNDEVAEKVVVEKTRPLPEPDVTKLTDPKGLGVKF